MIHLDVIQPGLNRGCVGAGDKSVEFEVLDRVVCVDPSGPLPLGQKGTVIGLQNPVDEERQEEEAFRSTSATVLKTIIVLPDPSSGACGQEKKKEDELRSALISILKISAAKDPLPSDAPKLLSFYPFQLLNISQYQKKNRPRNQPQSLSMNQLEQRFGNVHIADNRYPSGNYAEPRHSGSRYYTPAEIRHPIPSERQYRNVPPPATYVSQALQQRQMPAPMTFHPHPTQILRLLQRPPQPLQQQPQRQQHSANHIPPSQALLQMFQRPPVTQHQQRPYLPQQTYFQQYPPPPQQAKKLIQAPIPAVVMQQIGQQSARPE